LTFFYMLVASTLFNGATRHEYGIFFAILSLILYGNISHATSSAEHKFVASIKVLNGYVSGPNGWIAIGKTFHRLFYNEKNNVSISVNAAGAIPYYSGLPAIDTWGLNTRAVLFDQGVYYANGIPGHRFYAKHDFLMTSGANLVINHPIIVPRYKAVENCKGPFVNMKMNPILIPLPSGNYVLAHYITPHKRINRLLKNGKLLKCSKSLTQP
jgi:hypothetical protein